MITCLLVKHSTIDRDTNIDLMCRQAGRPYVVRQEDSILEYSSADPFRIRSDPEFCHENLKKVSIAGFCSAKSLI